MTAEPKRINVSCCAECPCASPHGNGGSHFWWECAAKGQFSARNTRIEADAAIKGRPIWCPLPILVTAEG